MAPEPSYPNARPGELPPVRPIDVLTDQGAEAFAVYFVKTLDWAYATMDTTLLEEASSPDCSLCQAFITEFAKRNAAHESIRGSRSTILTVDYSGGADPKSQLVNVVFSATALELYNADGQVIGTAEAIPLFQMNTRVSFDAARWTVVDAKKAVAQ